MSKVAEYKVGDIKCIDVDGKLRGVTLGCEGRVIVSLICDDRISHEQTDELARLLQKMKVRKVIVQEG